MRLLKFFLLLFFCTPVRAQQTLIIKITGGDNQRPVPASIVVRETSKGYQSGASGIASIIFPANTSYTLTASAVGYQEKEIKVVIPYASDTIAIALENSSDEMEEVIVQSTRTSRTISNVPTRVETIELEEIDEKSNMRPGNVAMILHESTGIQVQQTSATSGNAGIRIQGLDGRYTQLLKDGFASFANFSSGLSVLEIPPLDLRQVEIIKGPASPLYGGGAIAGVINFISKSPKPEPEYSFIVNQSNIGQSNIGGFAARRGKKAGYTLLALHNRQKAYDVDKDDFTEVPKSIEFTLHPRLFLFPGEHTTIIIGNSFTTGDRTGGDVQVIKDNRNPLHQYFERNQTIRNISTFEFDRKIGQHKRFVAKQSFSFFNRKITLPSYIFAGIDYNAFSDISYVFNADKHALVFGVNFIYNKFKQKDDRISYRNSIGKTGGLYGQHTWDATDKVKVESGLRIDVADYANALFSRSEVFILPRISVLVKYNAAWSSRIGAGMGYKTPTLFTEETEIIQYRNVAPLHNVRSEKSYGGTADVNYKAGIMDNLAFTLNHMFFYTIINKPLILETAASGDHSFSNASRPVHSAGFETNAKFIYKENFKLFLGYTFTDAKATYVTGNQFLPLVPMHKLNSALIYEKEGVVKLGLEGYFTGRQYLSDGTRTPDFSVFGFMAEKMFQKFSLYINFENFTDTRQSRYKNVINGSPLNPTFDEIWTHTEGFVVNGGLKLRL